MPMMGDDWLDGGQRARVRMTRAVTVEAEADEVWPWLAQLGRGAGWYSIDRLDNGGRRSARHLVSWVPEPAVGDATVVGYLRHCEPGRELVWWIPGDALLGATIRSVMAYRLTSEGGRCRVTARFDWDAEGLPAWLVLRLFQIIDTVMVRRQLLNLKQLVEFHASRAEDPEARETGERDQYQAYPVIYASGETAGHPQNDQADRWRRAAIRDGVLSAGLADR